MASILQDIHSFWSGSATLVAALPASKVYTDLVPETLDLPFATITIVSSIPTFQTGGNYFEETIFQVSIFSPSGATAESIGQTVQDVFDFAQISSDTRECLRNNYTVTVDPLGETGSVWQVIIEYGTTKEKARAT